MALVLESLQWFGYSAIFLVLALKFGATYPRVSLTLAGSSLVWLAPFFYELWPTSVREPAWTGAVIIGFLTLSAITSAICLVHARELAARRARRAGVLPNARLVRDER